MDEPDPADASALASHRLACLRRSGRQRAALVDRLLRRQDPIGRLDRDRREGLRTLQRGLRDGVDRPGRDIRAVRGDIALIENTILNRMSAGYAPSERIEELERRAGLA